VAHKKLSLRTKAFIAIAAILIILLLTGGAPDIAEFSAAKRIAEPSVITQPIDGAPLPVKPKPPLCFEGDKGLDIKNASFCKYATRVTNNGYTVYYSSPLYDSCVDESTVLEYFCTSPTTARCHAEEIPCGPDGICKDGACVPKTRIVYENASENALWILDATDDGTPIAAHSKVTIKRSPSWFVRNPALSHDGGQLTFEVTSVNPADNGIYLMDLSCPEAQAGCPPAQKLLPEEARMPEFSPDDTELLYRNVSSPSVWIYDLSTATSTLAYASAGVVKPTWSNLGNNITFAISSNLYTIPANCNNSCTPKQIASDSSPRGYWQGTDVAYGGISVVPYDGGVPRTVISGMLPVWSPDGKWIAYFVFSGPTVLMKRVNSDCTGGVGCDVATILDVGSGSPFDWQRLA